MRYDYNFLLHSIKIKKPNGEFITEIHFNRGFTFDEITVIVDLTRDKRISSDMGSDLINTEHYKTIYHNINFEEEFHGTPWEQSAKIRELELQIHELENIIKQLKHEDDPVICHAQKTLGTIYTDMNIVDFPPTSEEE